MALPDSLNLVYHAREAYPRVVPLVDVYRHLDLEPAAARPAVALNMVQTLDGVVAVAGKAWTIGSEVDHYLFRTLRGWADVVLSGAGTLRENDIVTRTHPHLQAERRDRGRSVNPAAVVVSRRAEFSDAVLARRFFTLPDFDSIVVTTELARDEDRRRAAAAGAEVVIVPATPAGDVDLNAALGWLAARGVRHVLAEGGPATNRGLVDAGLVDELFVTLVARVTGVPGSQAVLTGLLGGASADLRVISEFLYPTETVHEWYLRAALAGVRS
jgi:riboflavin biosynthesis pyrimidine reductase